MSFDINNRQIQTSGGGPLVKQIQDTFQLHETSLVGLTIEVVATIVTLQLDHKDGKHEIRRYVHTPEFIHQLNRALGFAEWERHFEVEIRFPAAGVITVTVGKAVDERFLGVDWSLLKLMPDSDPIYHSDRPLEQNALDKLHSMRLGQDWPDATGTLDSAH